MPSDHNVQSTQDVTRETLIADLQRLAEEHPDRAMTRDFYRANGNHPERLVGALFGSFPAFKREAGVAVSERDASLRGEVSGPALPASLQIPEGFVVATNSATYDEEGVLKRQSVKTRRGNGEVFEPPAGHAVKKISAFTDSDGRLIGRWTQFAPETGGTSLVESLEARFKAYEGHAPLIPAPIESETDLLTVYPLPDIHFGMKSWAAETGDNYDTDLAIKLVRASLNDLVAQSRPSRHATILVLGDYFHMNDQRNVTPRSGHKLDVDGRWEKVYEAGAALLMELVEMAAQKHEQVEVVCLPGNHDEDAAVTLRVLLSVFYKSNERISVYRRPGITWYRRFGTTLLGATHGHTMKPNDMALMMTADCADIWSGTEFRSIYFGHIHHETMKEVGPVRVESFQTPAPRDAHAQHGGYRSGRSLVAITHHTERGEIGRHKVNILPPKVKKTTP